MIKVKIGNIKELLSDNLTLQQRGFVLTCLLLKDDNDKLTFAKIKSSVKLSLIKNDLLYLHEQGIIEWSSYKKELEKLKDTELDPKLLEIVSFMNNLYGRDFKPESDSTSKNLRNRMKEYSIDDIKNVISNRWERWSEDPVMKNNLRPSTIFRPSKFDKYLEDVNSTGVGKGTVHAEKLDISIGTVLDIDTCDKLQDSITYTIKEFKVSKTGSKMGVGKDLALKGSIIKKLVGKSHRKKMRGYEGITTILEYNQ